MGKVLYCCLPYCDLYYCHGDLYMQALYWDTINNLRSFLTTSVEHYKSVIESGYQSKVEDLYMDWPALEGSWIQGTGGNWTIVEGSERGAVTGETTMTMPGESQSVTQCSIM